VSFFAAAQGRATTWAYRKACVSGYAARRVSTACSKASSPPKNLKQAIGLRARLAPGHSVITRDGIWIGPDWLRVSRDQDEHQGVIEREQALRHERVQLDQLQEKQRTLDAALDTLRQQLHAMEDLLADAQSLVAASGAAHLELRGQLDGLRPTEQRNDRATALGAQIAELDHELAAAESGARMSRERSADAVAAMAELDARRSALEGERDELRRQLLAARDKARRIAQWLAKWRYVSSHDEPATSLCSQAWPGSTDRSRSTRRGAWTWRRSWRGEQSEAALRSGLEERLGRRVSIEQDLGAARRSMEAVDARLRELDEHVWSPRGGSARRASCSTACGSPCRS
jgi:chromosome segregation protein